MKEGSKHTSHPEASRFVEDSTVKANAVMKLRTLLIGANVKDLYFNPDITLPLAAHALAEPGAAVAGEEVVGGEGALGAGIVDFGGAGCRVGKALDDGVHYAPGLLYLVAADEEGGVAV